MIRIIGGEFKGRRLKLVRDPAVRPMQDKLKGSLFNIIGDDLEGRWVLDGFAGTGSIGLEALSRGAARAVFVEELKAAAKVIAENAARCGAEDRALVVEKEFNRAVIDLAKAGVLFDFIFLDPPYRLFETRNPLKVVRKRGVLKPGGTLIVRHYFKVRPDTEGFVLRRTLALGDDVVTFLAPAPRGEGAGA